MLTALTHAAYFAGVCLLIATVPAGFLGEVAYATNTILVLGFLGTWRYSWAGLNYVRAVIFRRIVYPRRKARAFARFAARPAPCHAFFLVTTYMVDTESTIACYRALFLAAANARDGATIVASVVDGADARLIREVFNAMSARHDMTQVRLTIDRIKANGKRDALATSLHIIGRQAPTRNDIVVFVDGDTCVPADIVAQSAPMFTNPKLGALTTDEGVIIEKQNLFRDWFILRFNQRQVMMCSMGLSNRVLTLTGRMSVFRADLATDPGFINEINDDFLDHWRLGRVTFLTGDDKSTWYWLLRHGYQMGYLPDVQSLSMETQPGPTFYGSSKTLMVRWFGNMMRTNGRALRLSPAMIGPFTWWSILDQRVSMWTTLVGPMAVAFSALTHSVYAIPLYVAWVMLTRYAFCVAIALFRGGWFPITHPPILYFGQIVGAAVKTFVLFRLDRQKWTRQGGAATGGGGLKARLLELESSLHHTLGLAWLAVGVVILMQL